MLPRGLKLLTWFHPPPVNQQLVDVCGQQLASVASFQCNVYYRTSTVRGQSEAEVSSCLRFIVEPEGI